MSIWAGLNRCDFEAKVNELQKIAPSQRLASIATLEAISPVTDGTRTKYTLPIEIEEQVADDIAFLAACQNLEGGVTAATLQGYGDHNKTTINLAANEGIPDEIIDSMTRMLKVLEVCAQKVIGRKDCSTQILDLMLDLHRFRILGRLGLPVSKITRRGRPRKCISISDRLEDLLSEPCELGNHVTRAPLLLEIRILKEVIEDLQDDTSKTVASFKRVVEMAANIAKPAESLTNRLIKAGFSDAQVQRKEIRQIKGLANYVHCCNRLSNAARTYRVVFESLTLKPIIADRVEIWPVRSGIKHFVHAEIQLLVHHDAILNDRRPRYIGVSKRACFLCYCFLRAYGLYAMPETHGEVFPQWTVPDRDDFTKSSKQRLRRALSRTASDVSTALTASIANKQRFPPGIQSRDHSIIFSLGSASASTLRPVSITKGHFAETPTACSDHRKVPGSSIHASTTSHSLLEDCPIETPAAGPNVASLFEFEWLTLHVYSDRTLSVSIVDEDIDQPNANACDGSSRAAKTLAANKVIKIEDRRLDAGLTMIGAKANELEVAFMRNDGSQLRIQFATQSKAHPMLHRLGEISTD